MRSGTTWVMQLGLWAGLGVSLAIPHELSAKDNVPVQQERCQCDCGGTPVDVIPTGGPANEANCKAMNNKTCRNPSTGKPNALSCSGTTIVSRPRPGMPQVSLQGGAPMQRR
jgi:hypothetical protein